MPFMEFILNARFKEDSRPSLPRCDMTALGARFAGAGARATAFIQTRGGKRKWWLPHEGQNSPTMTFGRDLPQAFPAIRKEMEEPQLARGGDDTEATTHRPASKVSQCF
jgi:hypothetical protein